MLSRGLSRHRFAAEETLECCFRLPAYFFEQSFRDCLHKHHTNFSPSQRRALPKGVLATFHPEVLLGSELRAFVDLSMLARSLPSHRKQKSEPALSGQAGFPREYPTFF